MLITPAKRERLIRKFHLRIAGWLIDLLESSDILDEKEFLKYSDKKTKILINDFLDEIEKELKN